MVRVKEKLEALEAEYLKSAEYEGEEYKWMSMRNDDIEFLIDLAKKQVESESDQAVE